MDEKQIREWQSHDDNILRVLSLCWESAQYQPQNSGQRRALIESAIKERFAALSRPAAADEALVALKDVLEVWPNKGRLPGWCQRWTNALNRAHAAIAKATP